MKIRVILFKNWKHVFKHMYQTGLGDFGAVIYPSKHILCSQIHGDKNLAYDTK